MGEDLKEKGKMEEVGKNFFIILICMAVAVGSGIWIGTGLGRLDSTQLAANVEYLVFEDYTLHSYLKAAELEDITIGQLKSTYKLSGMQARFILGGVMYRFCNEALYDNTLNVSNEEMKVIGGLLNEVD